MIDPKRILIVSPHTDDAEVSSGGTIARFLREGREVYIVVLSLAHADQSQRPAEECHQAMKVLGIDRNHFEVHNFPVRRLQDHRQEVLDTLLHAKFRFNPDLVVIPSLSDVHQDHHCVAEEGLRAFKNHASILGFSYPWNLLAFNTTCFVKFDEEDLSKKVAAVECYKSQKKPYMEQEAIWSWAITTGLASQTRYAESFEVVRLVA